MLDELTDLYITISEDGLTAFLTINAPYESFPSEEEIKSKLAESSVVFGVDEQTVQSIASEKTRTVSKAVAFGLPAIGSLRWHVDVENPSRPTITNQNRADFKNLTLYHFIRENDVIVSLREAGEARAGKTVTGERIEPDMSDELPRIKNSVPDASGKQLIAAHDGYLMWEDGQLSVSEIFHVSGDVDYGTGNLKLKGKILIDGDVRSGFRVESDDDITINGTVDAAHIYSQSGNITIRNGILGQGRAKVLCGGDLHCGFMQDAHVAVRGNIFLEKYAINCIVSSGGRITAEHNEGLIRGGSTTADKGIVVKNAGSPRGVYTEFKIRNYTEDSGQGSIWKISKKRAELTLRLSGLKKRRDFLFLLQDNKNISDSKKKELGLIGEEINRIKEKLADLQHQELELQKSASKEKPSREVRILNTVNRNVAVDIAGLEYFFDSELDQVRMYVINGEIIVESLKNGNHITEVEQNPHR